MDSNKTIRPGEILAVLPDQLDAGVYFVGRVRTPWATRDICPRRGDPSGPECRIELDPRWERALEGIAAYPRIEVLYWMHQARRDLLIQVPLASGKPCGTFALRSPVRPNPIASSVVDLVSIARNIVIVRGLDCLDGTPLIDLKPARDNPGSENRGRSNERGS
jgi:tRNA (adenine37-N6)-methyltransferase